MAETDSKPRTNFIRNIIDNDLADKKNNGRVYTRFPPEPNGYLHIGHAKSICLNFGIAEDYNGKCNLRFDDTNPEKESEEFIQAIETDVRWLEFQWAEKTSASQYFDKLYEFAVAMIKKGLAYVDSQNAEEIRTTRGTLTEPGQNSPYRERTIEENLSLFEKMRAGDFDEGSHVLRAKIDMAHGNINMRDPVMYRIRKVHHHATGDKWCIYPMYDYTHCVSDALEGITHSLCTLEFEDHRPLYDWFLDQLETGHHPQQIEFSRLNLQYTVMSKRMLVKLVDQGHVEGFDDPRMPTLAGLRRRGYTPAAIRDFCEAIGISKSDSNISMTVLEDSLRNDLNTTADRRMAVLKPLKVIITNYPDDQVEEFEAKNHPDDEDRGRRKVTFSKEIYVEEDDFLEEAPKKFFRLTPGREVRLRYAYYVTCTRAIKDEQGKLVAIECTYDPESRGGRSDDGRKVKGTIHWVDSKSAVPARVKLYDRLFKVPNPAQVNDGDDFTANLNENSLEHLEGCLVEPALQNAEPGVNYQFERLGYFTRDSKSTGLVFNRSVSLRDSWAKFEKQQGS